jgi:hypothetical protein
MILINQTLSGLRAPSSTCFRPLRAAPLGEATSRRERSTQTSASVGRVIRMFWAVFSWFDVLDAGVFPALRVGCDREQWFAPRAQRVDSGGGGGAGRVAADGLLPDPGRPASDDPDTWWFAARAVVVDRSLAPEHAARAAEGRIGFRSESRRRLITRRAAAVSGRALCARCRALSQWPPHVPDSRAARS